MKKLQLFDQNHGLSALQKGQFCLRFKSMFILSRKASFLTRTSANTFLWVYFAKNEMWTKFPIFWSNPLTNPFGKIPILWVFCFRCSERLVWYIKRQKSFFHDLFSRSMTWEYRGLHGVSRGYRWLQGFIRR